jgi:hypothetical protein
MPRSDLHQETGVPYRLYDAADVPQGAVEAMADASLTGWEVHALPRLPRNVRPSTDEDTSAFPRDIVFFPPHLATLAQRIVGDGLTPSSMSQLGLQFLIGKDTESPTGDSWICLRNRAEADKLMQRAARAINRKSPGASRLVTPTEPPSA